MTSRCVSVRFRVERLYQVVQWDERGLCEGYDDCAGSRYNSNCIEELGHVGFGSRF